MDAAYQALNAGFIPSKAQSIKREDIVEITSISANYRFVRKYFALHWYAYVLVIRLITLNNPLVEIWNFIRYLPTSRYRSRLPIQHEVNNDNLGTKPLVSIIIPTLNRYEYLKDALSDLEKQDYQNFEVVICDQSIPIDEQFYQGWNLSITLIKQNEQALWLARNKCICRSKGDLILLYDDDSRVASDWIASHIACLEHFQVDISAGVTNTVIGHGQSAKDLYYHLSDVFDTGNAMVRREVFERIGLFDRQFEKQRMGDGEFGLRATLSGYQIISNPKAKRIHLKADVGGLRQMGSWDAFIPKDIWSPRPIPSVLYFARKYFGSKASIYLLISSLPKSLVPYQLKGSKPHLYLSILTLPFLFPIIAFQILKSWHLSSLKLKTGPLISTYPDKNA
jgi:glycosyltransferase involved in cell wall biosynthesis